MTGKQYKPRINVWFPTDIVESGNILMDETLEVAGSWMTLCRRQWLKQGSLPNDDVKLARFLALSKSEWLKIRPALEPYFTVTDTEWFSQFIAEEYTRSSAISMKRTIVAKQRWINEKLLKQTGGEIIPDMDKVVLDIARQSASNEWNDEKDIFAINSALRKVAK